MKDKKNLFKRSLAILLVVVTLVGVIPTSVIATAAESMRSDSYIPGDVNGDEFVDAKDINLVRRYIAGGYDVTINEKAADVNADESIDAKDVNLVRRYIVGGYDVELKPAPEPVICAVAFYDGERLIDVLTAEKDQPLGAVPSVEKSSKDNAILLGYFTDPEFTEPFYAENPVTEDMKVYAKYEEMGPAEELNFTSFAQMDQQPDISFEVVGTGDPAKAVTLEIKDGSDPVELNFEATADGYIVSAKNGFNEGSSYQLHLAEGWNFKDKPDTIRTATFSIFKEQVENLKMNDEIIYILDTDEIDYVIGEETYDMLTKELITEGGSFTYDDAAAIEIDDIICIYLGVHPEERDFEGAEMFDPVYYVKATDVDGTTVTFTELGEDDFLRLYNIPDNFPILVDVLPADDAGTVNINALDEAMYTTMMGDGYDLAKALESIEVGDFITLYASADDIYDEAGVYFGEVIGYNEATGEITYKKTTQQAILESMDLYRDVDVDGEDFVTDEEKVEIETLILDQISQSSFAEDAAFMLADMVAKTDGFKNANLESLIITDSQGNELSGEDLQLMGIGKGFELTDDIKLTVELIRSGPQLHYKNGTQIAVGVEAEFEVELEDDEKIVIELGATFVQEVAISPKVSGYVIPYFVGLVPLPVGGRFKGTVDIKSFTAFSFEATVYTVAPEDESLWDQLKDVVKNPEKLADLEGLPEGLTEGLNTAGDVLGKINEMKDDLAKLKDTADETLDTIHEYEENIMLLWETIDHVITEQDYSAICDALDQKNVTSELLDMLDLTDETGLGTEYYESLEALMERYCEMVEKETDWVTLINKDIFQTEVNVLGVAIGIDVDFLVRADMSISIGSNMQYEVGKRYEFVYKFAPAYKDADCTIIDLLDERFAFQFYVMGRLGLKAGIKAKIECGIGSTSIANAGLSAELGPYFKMWGFYVYEYEKYRISGTKEWISNERMGGAVVMEFGLYIKLAFEAETLGGLFSYENEFIDEEFPLLTIGNRKYYYQPSYKPEEGEVVLVKDADADSQNGIKMTLPEYLAELDYLHLSDAYLALEFPGYDKFIYTVSNPNFSIDPKTGEIVVNVPDGVRYMECDLTITYKYGKFAFSKYDMAVTVPLVWTNLVTDELNEYYTASVRVGNDADGYTTVWQKRVQKNKEFDLPTEDEIKEIIGWNEYQHEMGTGYGDQQTEGLTMIDNKVYDFNIDYKTYSITVTDVENADGSIGEMTFTAKYGETFDFSALEGTGTVDYENCIFTKFAEVVAPAGLDLTKAIDTRMAAKLANGATATARYIDYSINVTFVFNGISINKAVMTIRRGDVPSLADIEAIVSDLGMAIVDISPAIGPVNSSVVYEVTCGELTTDPATITFVENGGSDVEDITKPYGSLIGELPVPEKQGYTFEGWYADEALTQLFTETKLPEGGATVYAKWTVNEYTVNFHVNGGNAMAEDKMTVVYGEAYGEMPKPEKSGYGFIGWFTAAEGGEQITSDSIYAVDGNQTLYAQWRELIELPADTFDFGVPKKYTYEFGKTHNIRDISMSYVLPGDLTFDDFTFEFLAEGYEEEGYVAEPMEAGNWGVKISRAADDKYAKFEQFYSLVLVIEKGNRGDKCISIVSNEKPEEEIVFEADNGMTYLKINLVPFDWKNPSFDELYQIYVPDYPITIDASEDAKVILYAYANGTQFSEMDSKTPVSSSGVCDPMSDIMICDLQPDTYYQIYGKIVNDRNYNDSNFYVAYPFDYYGLETNKTSTPPASTGFSWTDYSDYYSTYDISWYNETDTEFVIDTPAELAGVARLVNNEKVSFKDKTIKLAADLDMSAYKWIPIGVSSPYFRGTFDGQGHTVSGLYTNTPTTEYVGLFAVAAYGAKISNLVVDDSWFYGKSRVGGIAGYVYESEINNCVSYANVKADQRSKSDDYQSCAGGIVGQANYSTVINCVNYGPVYSEGRLTGGIVGLVEYDGLVANNANFGAVTGSSRVGGIVGCMDGDDTETVNNYNLGQVRPNDGSNDYIGAIVGRNVSDNGAVMFNYYLKDCAKGGNGKSRYAVGNDGGSVTDGKKNYYAASFETPLTKMSATAGDFGTGKTLIDALNGMIEAEREYDNEIAFKMALWEAKDENSYPLPEGTLTSALRKKQ